MSKYLQELTILLRRRGIIGPKEWVTLKGPVEIISADESWPLIKLTIRTNNNEVNNIGYVNISIANSNYTFWDDSKSSRIEL